MPRASSPALAVRCEVSVLTKKKTPAGHHRRAEVKPCHVSTQIIQKRQTYLENITE